jgi:hypothetical protein
MQAVEVQSGGVTKIIPVQSTGTTTLPTAAAAPAVAHSLQQVDTSKAQPAKHSSAKAMPVTTTIVSAKAMPSSAVAKAAPVDPGLTAQYMHYKKACVTQHNLKGAKYAGKTQQDCAQLCEQNPDCVAYEFGVDYGGSGAFKAGDCQLNDDCDPQGCNGEEQNVDLYVKVGYKHIAAGCVAEANMPDGKFEGLTILECSKKCDASDKCEAFEYGVNYGGSATTPAGVCQLNDAKDPNGCDGHAQNLDLYVKAACSAPTPSACEDTACMENGGMDADCCSKPSTASCSTGYKYSKGPVCYGVEFFKTCCTREGSQAATTTKLLLGVTKAAKAATTAATTTAKAAALADTTTAAATTVTTVKANLPSQNAEYLHIVKGCTMGKILQSLPGQSLSECKQLCNGDPKCLSFEYGVDYGAGNLVGSAQIGDCRPKDSKEYQGCEGELKNVDAYIKKLGAVTTPTPTEEPVAVQTIDFVQFPQRCVTGYDVAAHTGKSIAQCIALCSAAPTCKSFEYGVASSPSQGAVAGTCNLKSSEDAIGCDAVKAGTDLYIKATPPYTQIAQGCVMNCPGATKHAGQTAAECETLCTANPECKSFNYGVAYQGSVNMAGDCEINLCDSADSRGCNGKENNYDLYVKAQNTAYTIAYQTCVSGHALASYPNSEVGTCQAFCDSEKLCKAFQLTKDGMCTVLSSDDNLGCDGKATNTDLYLKTPASNKLFEESHSDEVANSMEADHQRSLLWAFGAGAVVVGMVGFGIRYASRSGALSGSRTARYAVLSTREQRDDAME